MNKSNRSSERSEIYRESNHSQRAPNSQRSRSVRSTPMSRHPDSKSRWTIPVWVHCESCYVNHDVNPNLSLLTCLHIFCGKCLRLDNFNAALSNDSIACPMCNTVETYKPINSSMDEKLHGMFQKRGWNPSFKSTYEVQQRNYMDPEWVDRYNGAKKAITRIQKAQMMDNELNTKTGLAKSEALKKYKRVQVLRLFCKRRKIEILKQQRKQQQEQQSRHHGGQGNFQKSMKFISSGRNEQSNQYIGQLKSSNRPVNQNQSAPIFRNQNVTLPGRQNLSLNQCREGSSKLSAELGSMKSATFRPQPKDFSSDNRQSVQQLHAQKRSLPSYNYDKYTTPSKRATHYPVQRATKLNTSISSVASSEILNQTSQYSQRAGFTRFNI